MALLDQHKWCHALYRATLVVADLGWVDFDFYVPCHSSANFPAALAELGRKLDIKILVNPTQVRDHQCHPVQVAMTAPAQSERRIHSSLFLFRFLSNCDKSKANLNGNTAPTDLRCCGDRGRDS